VLHATEWGQNLPILSTILNPVTKTRDALYNGTDIMGADSLNATILQRDLQNNNPTAFQAVMEQYSTDPAYLSAKSTYEAKNPGSTYTTQQYQNDLLIQGIQIQRTAQPQSFIGDVTLGLSQSVLSLFGKPMPSNQTFTSLDFAGDSTKALLKDNSNWLVQDILTETVDPNKLQTQLNAIKTIHH